MSIVSLAMLLGATTWLLAWSRGRLRTVLLAREIAKLRDQIGRQIDFRVPTDADVEVVAQVRARIDAAAAKLDLRGFTLLGEFVSQPARCPPLLVTRVWADDRKTTHVLVGARVGDRSPAIVTIASVTGELEIGTAIGTHVRTLAPPPFAQRQTVPADLPFVEVLARHRAFAAGDLVVIESFDHFLRELQRFHNKHLAWRESQPPLALLDADVRNLLGPGYDQHGKAVVMRMLPRLPTATLRRRA